MPNSTGWVSLNRVSLYESQYRRAAAERAHREAEAEAGAHVHRPLQRAAVGARGVVVRLEVAVVRVRAGQDRGEAVQRVRRVVRPDVEADGLARVASERNVEPVAGERARPGQVRVLHVVPNAIERRVPHDRDLGVRLARPALVAGVVEREDVHRFEVRCHAAVVRRFRLEREGRVPSGATRRCPSPSSPCRRRTEGRTGAGRSASRRSEGGRGSSIARPSRRPRRRTRHGPRRWPASRRGPAGSDWARWGRRGSAPRRSPTRGTAGAGR